MADVRELSTDPAVKPSGAAALTTDNATVVALSPNSNSVSVISQPELVTTGTITTTDIVVAAPTGNGALLTGTPTAGSYVAALATGGNASVVIGITGLTSGTIYYEGSADSTTGIDGGWVSLNMKQAGIVNTQISSAATASGLYRGNTAGIRYIRMRSVGALTGTPVITLRLSAGVAGEFLFGSIPTGANTIGSVKLTDGTNTPAVKSASTAPLATDPALVVTDRGNAAGISVLDGRWLVSDGFNAGSVDPNTFSSTGNPTAPVFGATTVDLSMTVTTASAIKALETAALFTPVPGGTLGAFVRYQAASSAATTFTFAGFYDVSVAGAQPAFGAFVRNYSGTFEAVVRTQDRFGAVVETYVNVAAFLSVNSGLHIAITDSVVTFTINKQIAARIQIDGTTGLTLPTMKVGVYSTNIGTGVINTAYVDYIGVYNTGMNGQISDPVYPTRMATVSAVGSLKVDAISNAAIVSAATVLQNAVAVTGNGVNLPVTGYGTTVLQVSGTFVANINFEASIDAGVTWTAISATQVGFGDIFSVVTTPGLFRLTTTGMDLIRARVTWTSGTSVTVSGKSTNAINASKIVKLATSTNSIGTVQTATPTAFSLSSAATTNATSVKATAGTVFQVTASNVGAAAAFLKLFNLATAPTVGTSVPFLTLPVPATGVLNIPLGALGMRFATGIAFSVTNLIADTDATVIAAAQVKVAIAYL